MCWKRLSCAECKVALVSFSYYQLLKNKIKLQECLQEAVTEVELLEFRDLHFLAYVYFVVTDFQGRDHHRSSKKSKA